MILKKTIKYILLAIVLIAAGYYSMKVFSLYSAVNAKKEEVAIVRNETTGGKVLGEEGNQVPTKMYASQNFKTPQISFGGDAITMPSGQQAVAPEILDMRSELLTTKTDQQVKFLLSWKTNKLCRSSIAYTKEGQAEAKTVTDDNFGFVHSVEIAPLNYSTSYSYTVTARDKWGTETNSDKLAFYTGAQNVSIFDLLGSAFKDMFGWAGKK
jgi:hypothetical protein